jgi:osmotically inducible lipoprotein OsmB
MKRMIAGACVLMLAACGTTKSERGLSGASIGAGVGLLGGPGGVLVGAAVGGGVGYLTDKEDLYLGEPIWE